MNSKHHYSIYVSDAASLELIERQENKNEFLTGLIAQFAAGELVSATDPKHRKLAAEASLAEKKLAAFDENTSLKRESIRVDIDLKLAQNSLTGAELQRRLNAHPTYHKRYILPSPDGAGLDYFCPICFKLVERATRASDVDEYTQTKIKIVKHTFDAHGARPLEFDNAFPSYNQFERVFYGTAIKATASSRELALAFGEPLPE